MDLQTAMRERHSVRRYLDRPIGDGIREELDAVIGECNVGSGLHIQLVENEPKAFEGFWAHYGKFSGVTNYVALIGKKGDDEKIGYNGEKIALAAQALGLNSCWVALTYKKIPSAFTLNEGEKLFCVLALGYGETQGVPHRGKTFARVASVHGGSPQWFQDGVNAALLAPTAMNQQKFTFTLKGDAVSVKAGLGFYAKVDLGIVKYHFELGSGKEKYFRI